VVLGRHRDVGEAMTQNPDEPGTWWTGFPGSDRAAWATPSPVPAGDSAPARDTGSKRPLRERLTFPAGRRERATRPADRVILADSNDDMPHGYIRLGGAAVEELPRHQRPLSVRGFHQACVEGRIGVYADLRDAVAWLLGFWSIDQVFGRYRNYEGEKDRPLTEPEKKHLHGLMDEATIVVDKFVESDPEQVRWLAQIRESFAGTQVSVVATPWDQSLANRVPLDLGAVASATLDAKLAMAEVVLRSADRANRRRQGLPGGQAQGLPEGRAEDAGAGQWSSAEPPRWFSEPLPPDAGPDSPDAEPGPADPRLVPAGTEPDGMDIELGH
jgi:hypothetical protein